MFAFFLLFFSHDSFLMDLLLSHSDFGTARHYLSITATFLSPGHPYCIVSAHDVTRATGNPSSGIPGEVVNQVSCAIPSKYKVGFSLLTVDYNEDDPFLSRDATISVSHHTNCYSSIKWNT
jgi:hypothetical protein